MERVERITEKQMTAIVRRMFGDSYYAVKRQGYREIIRALDGDSQPTSSLGLFLQADSVRGATWREALQLARVHFGWTKEAIL